MRERGGEGEGGRERVRERERGREEGRELKLAVNNKTSVLLTSFSSLFMIGISIILSGFSPKRVVGWHGNASSSSSVAMSRKRTGTRSSIPGDRFLWNGNTVRVVYRTRELY